LRRGRCWRSIRSFAIGSTVFSKPASREILAGWARHWRAGLRGFWRYKIGSYRIMCRIEDERFAVVVVAVGHRDHIYKGL
jgi:mRNA interferase RelE/StbE